MDALMDSTAQAMDEARKRNIMATDIAMKPIAYEASRLPARYGFEIKADGIGLLDVNGYVQSLGAVPFAAADHLVPELAAIREAFGRPMVLHGEYIHGDGFNTALSQFKSGQGNGAILLWDAVPLDVWLGHEMSQPLIDRRAALQAVIDMVKPKAIGLLEFIVAGSPEHVEIGANEAISRNMEGIVVKDMDSPYVRGPSAYWMKIKRLESADVPIQAVKHDGGRLTSLIVTLGGKPNYVPVGFSEAQREQLDEYRIGRIVEIKHNGLTAGGLMKGASFLRFRDDKEIF